MPSFYLVDAVSDIALRRGNLYPVYQTPKISCCGEFSQRLINVRIRVSFASEY